MRAPDLTRDVEAAQADLRRALNTRADLERGAGPFHDKEAGRAVRDLQQAQVGRQQAERDAVHAGSWRQRRAATKQLTAWADRETDARKRYDMNVIPEIRRLDAEIESSRAALEHVEARKEQYHQAERALAELSATSSKNFSQVSARLAAHRNDIDGVAQPAAQRPTRDLLTRQMRPHPRTVEPPTPPPQQPGISL